MPKKDPKRLKAALGIAALADQGVEGLAATAIALNEKIEDTRDELLEKVESISKMEGPAGKDGESIKGDKGDTPVKGIDYFTEEDIDIIKDMVTPKKGIDYKDGRNPMHVGKKPPIKPQIGDLWYKN